MKKDNRSKRQRKVSSQRKTWTNAERFEMVRKNELRAKKAEANHPLLKMLKQELAKKNEEAPETEAVHEHGENCHHDHDAHEEDHG